MSSDGTQQAPRPPFNLESSLYRLTDLVKNNHRELSEAIKGGLGRDGSSKPLPSTFKYATWVGFAVFVLLMVVSFSVSISAFMDFKNASAESGVDNSAMQKAVIGFLIFLGAFSVCFLALFTIAIGRG